jgi:serine/threonine-protein phosphatase PGAM5
MAKRTLYLIRHGQYQSNTTPPEQPDGNLTEIGKEQARLAAERLKTQPIHIIHFSTLQRTTETANYFINSLPNAEQRPTELLWECIPNVPAGFEQYFTHLSAEHIVQSGVRANEVFETFFKPLDAAAEDSHELMVTHGNLISYLVCRALNAPVDSWLSADVNNCSLSKITVTAHGHVKLSCHNDTGHLTDHLRT